MTFEKLKARYGLKGALMLSAIHHATNNGPAEGVSIKRGQRWAVRTLEGLQRGYFPHWQRASTVRVLKQLRAEGVVFVARDKATDSDRRLFRIDYDALGSHRLPSPQWIKDAS